MKEELDFLDELLKDRVEEAQIPFKEEYWTKMEARLDEEDKGKKRGFPYWRGLSVLLVLLATGIGAYVVPKFMTKKSEAKNEQSASPYAAEQPEVVTAEPAEPKTSSSQASNMESSMPENESSLTTSLSSNDVKKVKTPKAEESSVTNQVKAHDNQQSVNTDDSKTKNTMSSSQPESSDTKENSNTTAKPSLESKAASDNEVIVRKSKIKQKKNRHANALLSARTGNESAKKDLEKNAKNDTPRNAPNQPAPVVSSEASSTPSNEVPVLVNGKPYTVKDKKVEKTRAVLLPEQSNPRYMKNLENYTPIVDCTITYTLAPVKADPVASAPTASTATASNTPSPEVKRQPQDFEKRLLIFATLGMNLNKGLKGNSENQQSWAVSPYVGLGIEKPVRRDVSISAALGFTYFNGLNMLKRDNLFTYSFGVDSTEQKLYTQKLYQLYLPINVQLKLMERHMLFGGLGMTYSFQTSGKLEQTTYSPQAYNLNPSQSKSQTNTSLVSEYNKGFQTFDFFLQAGYSYRFMERWSSQILIQQGFLDISKNSYYNNTIRNNLTRVSIGLKFNLR
ncbi:MAG: outer membrane beta-barrel protein [Chitinophagaceae bacterium]|nr:outer membrane beta-barrel protein [Chitinophagaceae bacterium]